ncbi:MAG: cupin domain-containing protein [Planctomycetota bacterium]
MASIRVPAEDRRIEDPAEVAEFLAPLGIWYERWEVAGRIGPDATGDEILAAYEPEIKRLKQRGGFVTADVINVSPDTPGLDAMLAKFDKEHTHSEDEVRFTVEGRGVFWVNPADSVNTGGDPVFAIEVTSGDLINVPAGTKHWFHLCDDRRIRCIRLFEDPSGWTPEYLDGGVHAAYAPVCWGGSYLPKAEGIESPVHLAD